MTENRAVENWENLLSGREIIRQNNRDNSELLDARNLNVARPHSKEVRRGGPWNVVFASDLLQVRRASWRHVDFTNSQIPGLRVFDSEVINCKFDNCKLRDLRVWGTSFADVSFHGADLRGATLGPFYEGKRNTFSKINFSKTDLRDTIYQSAAFNQCQFLESKLDKVEFQGSTFSDCTFHGELREVIFYSHTFGYPSAPENQMDRVDFSRATLRWCSFRGLNLDSVIFPTSPAHVILRNYPIVIDELLRKFGSRLEPEWRRLIAVLSDARRWLGPRQRVGVFNKDDLLEMVGEANIDELIAAIDSVAIF